MTPNLHLPHLLREITDRYGLEAALLLAKEFGGKIVKLPLTARPDHPIAVLVSQEVLTWLVEYRPGQPVTIPMGPRHPDKIRAAYREAEVQRLTAEGWSSAKIGEHLTMHERSVRLIRERTRAPDRQMDLFKAS